jgi:glycosyltransferase involved in cell wall biosynthesis
MTPRIHREPMTILQLISSEGFYGAESMLSNLARALTRLGCSPIVGAFKDARNPHIEVAEAASRAQIRVQILPCEGRWDTSTVRNIRKILEECSVDVLHTHGYKADLYGYVASRSLKVARVSTCHNWPDPKRLMQAYASLNRLVLRAFDEVTTPSPQVAEILRRSGIREHRLSFIGNGVDVESFRHATPTLRSELCAEGQPIVGFVGRLVPDKGGAELVRAAQTVLASRPDARFVFVGEGACRDEWQALASQLGIASNVVFMGARQDMPGVYASFDIFVLPSFKEAMPMSVLEAMSAGRPVIATPVGAVPEVMVDGRTGLLCKPRDVDGLSRAILELLEDSTRARGMGESGYARAAADFSGDAMARKYLGVYKKALGNREAGVGLRTMAHEG